MYVMVKIGLLCVVVVHSYFSWDVASNKRQSQTVTDVVTAKKVVPRLYYTPPFLESLPTYSWLFLYREV